MWDTYSLLNEHYKCETHEWHNESKKIKETAAPHTAKIYNVILNKYREKVKNVL
jgi:hypothetical protein